MLKYATITKKIATRKNVKFGNAFLTEKHKQTKF